MFLNTSNRKCHSFSFQNKIGQTNKSIFLGKSFTRGKKASESCLMLRGNDSKCIINNIKEKEWRLKLLRNIIGYWTNT